MLIASSLSHSQASQVALVLKNPPANAGDTGSILGSGKSPGEGNGSPCFLAWEIPWTEESGGLQSMDHKEFRHDLATKQQQQIKYRTRFG